MHGREQPDPAIEVETADATASEPADAYGQGLESDAPGALPEPIRAALHELFDLRRDVRHFRPGEPVDEAAFRRALEAAHRAPSVGFSQPWRFIVVRAPETRARIRDSFLKCREAEAGRFPAERRAAYLAHRLEGILTSALNLCVAVDLRDQGEAILGTTAQPEAVRASVCCAVQNFWLAARAEGLGVGWVSIIEPAVLRAALALPPGVEPVAYLCVGVPVAFRRRPMLEETGWGQRKTLAEVLHEERHAPEPGPRPEAGEARPTPDEERSFIPPFSETARAAARAHQARLTKPAGSLGRLEEIAAWYAGARGAFPPPAIARARLVVFAADHGVAEEGVSAYASSVTSAMLANILAGGAGCCALAAASGVDLEVVDVGVRGDRTVLPRAPRVPWTDARVRAGTGNIAVGPAMTGDEARAAMAAGAAAVRDADVLAAGEIGIGNTTAAAALISALTGLRPARIVGRGTGVDGEVWRRKVAVVEAALARSGPPADPLRLMAELGGLELAAITGFFLEAARRRIPVVLDGFLTGAAALVASAIDRNVRAYLLASHRSAESGAAATLEALQLEPLLDLGLRLGEGTGAVLAIQLLRAAVHAQAEMATFATMGVVRT